MYLMPMGLAPTPTAEANAVIRHIRTMRFRLCDDRFSNESASLTRPLALKGGSMLWTSLDPQQSFTMKPLMTHPFTTDSCGLPRIYSIPTRVDSRALVYVYTLPGAMRFKPWP